ncbi:MAG TPA: hypothetical protein VGT41_00330 [Candidatus Babeliales bacterium]|nr:hypothetical protein [Candidatus Babeliales bacterium]
MGFRSAFAGKCVFMLSLASFISCSVQAAASLQDVNDAKEAEEKYQKAHRLERLRERVNKEAQKRLAPAEPKSKKGILGKSLAAVKGVACRIGLVRAADEDAKEEDDRKEGAAQSDNGDADYKKLRESLGTLSPDLRKYVCEFIPSLLTIFDVKKLRREKIICLGSVEFLKI